MAMRRLRVLAYPADEASDGERHSQDQDDTQKQELLSALSSFIDHGVQTPKTRVEVLSGDEGGDSQANRSAASKQPAPALMTPPTAAKGDDSRNGSVGHAIEDPKASSGLATSSSTELAAGSGNDKDGDLDKDAIKDPKASVDAAVSAGVVPEACSNNFRDTAVGKDAIKDPQAPLKAAGAECEDFFIRAVKSSIWWNSPNPKASVEAATAEAVELEAGSGKTNGSNFTPDAIDAPKAAAEAATLEGVELEASSGNAKCSGPVPDKIEDPTALVEVATPEAVEPEAGSGTDRGSDLVPDEIEDPKASAEVATPEAVELEAGSGDDNGDCIVKGESDASAASEPAPKPICSGVTIEDSVPSENGDAEPTAGCAGECEDSVVVTPKERSQSISNDAREELTGHADISMIEAESPAENQSVPKNPSAAAKRHVGVDSACSEAKHPKADELFDVLRANLEELIATTVEADAGTDVLDWARTLGRSRVTTKDSVMTMWFTIEKRKSNDVEILYVCLKTSIGAATAQVSSLKSDYSTLFKHALVFKAILLTAATLDSWSPTSVWSALRDAALEWV